MRLEGCRIRVIRATEQLEELKADILAYREKAPYNTVFTRQSDDGWHVIRFHITEPPSPVWSAKAGEILYGLRACLNELVFDLARLNVASPKGTSFPIYVVRDGPDGYFTPRGKKKISPRDDYLRGLSTDHKTVIDGLQPFGTPNDPLARLGVMTNLDKHQGIQVGILVVRAGSGVVKPERMDGKRAFEFECVTDGSWIENDAVILRARTIPPSKMTMRGRFGFEIGFGDAKLSANELFGIKDRVVQIVERFESAFA